MTEDVSEDTWEPLRVTDKTIEALSDGVRILVRLTLTGTPEDAWRKFFGSPLSDGWPTVTESVIEWAITPFDLDETLVALKTRIDSANTQYPGVIEARRLRAEMHARREAENRARVEGLQTKLDAFEF